MNNRSQIRIADHLSYVKRLKLNYTNQFRSEPDDGTELRGWCTSIKDWKQTVVKTIALTPK